MQKFLSLIDEKTKRMMIMLGIAIGIFVVILIIISITKGVSGEKVSYEKLSDIMVSAAEKYYDENKSVLTVGEKTTVQLNTLIEKKHMKELTKYTSNTTCTGHVEIIKNGAENLYIPSLTCDDYKTVTLFDKITEATVVSENGLHLINGEYVFKGDNVNNYVSFGGQTWRIIKIDKNGNLKLINSKDIIGSTEWDNRYNINTSYNDGINDFSLSRMNETLKEAYEGIDIVPTDSKKYVVYEPWCTGKRNFEDKSITPSGCNEKTENYFGLIAPEDYAGASFDPNCVLIDSKSCSNYNYLTSFMTTSWTLIATTENDYSALGIRNNIVLNQKTSANNRAFVSLIINGENLYKIGNGTKNDPYSF